MAVQEKSVVTPGRFEQGISWQEWMDAIDRNKDKFQENYDDTTLNPADVDAIKALMAKPGGPTKVLALGEAWCTDVVRGLPVAARLCEATGLELNIFFRDQHLDIMDEHLYKGEFQSIPVLAFFSADHKYIGHWLEKAKLVREQSDLLSEVTSKMRNPDISKEEREQYMAEYSAFQKGPVWDGWRHAQVTEIRELLEENVK